jgi:hypothetical protein
MIKKGTAIRAGLPIAPILLLELYLLRDEESLGSLRPEKGFGALPEVGWIRK